MYFLLAILIGIIIGLIRGGKVSSIFSHPYNKWYLGAVGIVVQILLHFYYLTNGLPSLYQYFPIVNFISYLLILVMLIFNLDDIFSIIIAVGVILDFVVIFINGGYFPVSESVVAVMPLYSKMVQSIYSGTNGIYSLMQPTQTLMSFLGVNIPIPFFTTIVVMTGTVCGLSIGGIFILLGLIGLTQRVMLLEDEPLQIEKPFEINKAREIPTQPLPQPPRFESKTEELFFEDELIPKSKLDRIFGDEDRVYPTRVLPRITPLEQSTAEIDSNALRQDTKIFSGLDELTKPIGREPKIEIISDTKPLKLERDKKEEPKRSGLEPIDENEGFFVSKFFAEREKNRNKDIQTDRLNTEELFQDENTLPDLEYQYTEPEPYTEPEEKPAKTRIKTEEVPRLSDLEISEPVDLESEEPEQETIVHDTSYLLDELNDFIPHEEVILETPETDNQVDLETNISLETEKTEPVEEEIPVEPLYPEENEIELVEEMDYQNDLNNEEILEELNNSLKNYDIFTEEKPTAYTQDEETGYIVTKAYKKEVASMDKSEAAMLNVWSQVSKETEQRKQNRRRQASPNYQTNNPYQEEKDRAARAQREREETVRQAQEAYERRKVEELNQHQQKTEETINLGTNSAEMSDEERIAAGYVKVEFEVGGRKIQFWKKDN